jgi:uncharacterized membrane protein
MLFNSYVFLLFFLPTTWILNRLYCKKQVLESLIVVFMGSIALFYAYWNPPVVLLILFVIAFCYSWSRIVESSHAHSKLLQKSLEKYHKLILPSKHQRVAACLAPLN